MGAPGRRLVGVVTTGLSVVIVFFVFVLTAEGIIRFVNPVPPLQIARLDRYETAMVGEIIMWFQDPGRTNISCTTKWPDARVVVFSGDSIFFGSGVETEEVFTWLLQKSLDEEFGVGSWCVINLAQPAFSFEQKREWLRDFARVNRIDHVYWEVWFSENVRYRVFGKTAYNFGPTVPAPGHIPDAAGIPLSVSEWLIQRSRLYEFAFLTFLRRDHMTREWWNGTYIPDLKELQAWLAERGAGLTLIPAPPLDRPFTERGPDTSVEDRMFISLKEFQGADVIFLGAALKNLNIDYRDVRYDACCHYNVEGHKVLAAMFKDIVVRDWREGEAEKAPADDAGKVGGAATAEAEE